MSLGSHTAVLLERAVEELKVRADGLYVDCTFGRGGHSRLILSRLGNRGRLIALDRDPDAVSAGEMIGDERFTMLHGAFGRTGQPLRRGNPAACIHPHVERCIEPKAETARRVVELGR